MKMELLSMELEGENQKALQNENIVARRFGMKKLSFEMGFQCEFISFGGTVAITIILSKPDTFIAVHSIHPIAVIVHIKPHHTDSDNIGFLLICIR